MDRHLAGLVGWTTIAKPVITRATIALSICLTLFAPQAAANAIEEQIPPAREQCVARLKDLHRQAERWQWVGIVLAGLGGCLAGFSGLKAGYSDPKSGRRWGWLALVAGAISATSPLLPKSDGYRDVLSRADRHYIMGLKVERQLVAFDQGRGLRPVAAQFVLSRFTECLAEEPAKEVPDPPSMWRPAQPSPGGSPATSDGIPGEASFSSHGQPLPVVVTTTPPRPPVVTTPQTTAVR